MKCALAAMGFIDGDLQHNKRVIIDTMKNYSDTADIVIFGEAFLQGFTVRISMWSMMKRLQSAGAIR